MKNMKKSLKNIISTWGLMLTLSWAITWKTNQEIVNNFADNTKNIENSISHPELAKGHKNDTADYNFNQHLQSLAFPDSMWLFFFKEWLSYNTFIAPQIISRQDFDSLKWDFLKQKDDTTNYAQYDLYLPDSIKIHELPSIIKKVNQQTFGENLPKYASSIELRNNLEHTIQYLLAIKTDENKQEIQKAVNKYCQIYQDFYWENPKLEKSNKSIDEYYFNTIKDLEKDENFAWKSDSVFADFVYQKFLESFFEMWSDMLWNLWDIKTTIWFESLKYQLQSARNSGNIAYISQLEKNILNKIMYAVNEYYRQYAFTKRSSNPEKSTPTYVVETNMTNCVSLAEIIHQLLSELDIKHYSRLTRWHIALEATLSNWNSYYLDPLNIDKTQNFKILETHLNAEKILVWKDTLFTIKWDWEKIIMTSVLYNQWQSKQDQNQTIYFLEKLLSIEKETNPISLYGLALAYEQNKQYEKALEAVEKAIFITPYIRNYRYFKREILWKLQIFDNRRMEASEMIDKYRKKK